MAGDGGITSDNPWRVSWPSTCMSLVMTSLVMLMINVTICEG